MTKTERLLTLLEALQDHPLLTGPQIAARLGVDVRAVRRDVAALQRLGLPVEAERGPGGGYRLRPGFRMPPLMLTANEATVIALALLGARRDGLEAGTALAKLRRLLPGDVRPRVEALEQTLSFTATAREVDPVAGEHLLLLAEGAWRSRRVAARYVASDGTESQRELSPWAVVAHAGRWYVPAYDHGRAGVRTLRADRFRSTRLGGRGAPRPGGFDAVEFVTTTLARVPWTHDVEVVLRADRATLASRFPPGVVELEAAGEDTVLRMRAESLDWVAGLLAGARCAFTVRRPDELRDSVHALAERLLAA